MIAPSVSTTLSCDRQEGGCLPHIGGSGFLVGSFWLSFYCCVDYLQRTAAAGIGAITSKTTLVATITKDDLACSDSGGLFQHGRNHPVRYNIGRWHRRHP
jgi:hypothetical protein